MAQQRSRKPIPRGLIKEVQRKLIIQRQKDVSQNPNLIDFDRWDLSKIFYDTRTFLDKLHYKTSPMNAPDKRKAIHNAVADICEELVPVGKRR
ncbi:MAG TPA: hypothetical protein VEH06_10565 [Candidatus Bathyarchaeia archaeon]|nr:hypothetical protein [Candidatus Bathyarchaeia archaeon]